MKQRRLAQRKVEHAVRQVNVRTATSDGVIEVFAAAGHAGEGKGAVREWAFA